MNLSFAVLILCVIFSSNAELSFNFADSTVQTISPELRHLLSNLLSSELREHFANSTDILTDALATLKPLLMSTFSYSVFHKIILKIYLKHFFYLFILFKPL